MKELFIILGILCSAHQSTPNDIKCVSFWENPQIEYDSKEMCVEKATDFFDRAKADLQKNNLRIIDFRILCVPVEPLDKLT